MADNRANLKTVISADSTQFNSALSRAVMRGQSAGAGIAKGVGRATLAMGKLAAKAAVAGSAIAAASAAAALFKGSKLAAQMESTAVAFETLTGSASTAKKVLEELRVLGAETPFEFPELADAGRKLIAFGEGADTVAETLRRVGDVSSAIQAPIGEIAELYGKARVQGRLFGEDINQLTGRGIPIIGQLAKQFGVTDDKVKKLVENGEIGFANLEKAFIDMTSTGGFAFGMMEKQSKTFNGKLSNLADAVGNLLTNLSAPINSALIPYLDKVTDIVAKMGPKMTEVSSRFVEGFNPSKIIPLFSAVGSLLVVAIGDGVGKGLQIAGALLAALFSKEGLTFIKDALLNTFIDAVNAMMPALIKLSETISKAMQGKLKEGEGAGSIGASILKASTNDKKAAKSLAAILEEEMGKVDWAASDRMKAAAKTFTDTVGDLFPKVVKDAAKGSESAKYDAELAEQRKRVAAGALPEQFGPSKKLMDTTFGPSKSLVKDQTGPGRSLANKGLFEAQEKQKEAEKKGAFGLANLYAMQVKKISGGNRIDGGKIGQGGMLAADRARLGMGDLGLSKGDVGSGSAFNKDRAKVAAINVTGGLGEKRRLNTSKDDRDAKKGVELQKTSADYLKDIAGGVKDALSVR